jgi:hypothetical protein
MHIGDSARKTLQKQTPVSTATDMGSFRRASVYAVRFTHAAWLCDPDTTQIEIEVIHDTIGDPPELLRER